MNDDSEDRRSPTEIVTLVREDFQFLVATLAEQIQCIDDPDSDALAALWKAKAAAERGLRLSELLEANLTARR